MSNRPKSSRKQIIRPNQYDKIADLAKKKSNIIAIEIQRKTKRRKESIIMDTLGRALHEGRDKQNG